jgi:hypothetical protein
VKALAAVHPPLQGTGLVLKELYSHLLSLSWPLKKVLILSEQAFPAGGGGSARGFTPHPGMSALSHPSSKTQKLPWLAHAMILHASSEKEIQSGMAARQRRLNMFLSVPPAGWCPYLIYS